MRGDFRPEPKFLAVVKIRGVTRSQPKFLALFTGLGARRFSVRTKTPGETYQSECEAFFGQNQNSWRRFPVKMRRIRLPELKFPAVLRNLNARCLSVRTEIPGDMFQFNCEAFFGQNQNSWQCFPVLTRCVFPSDPEFLAIFTNLNARRFSVRTKIPREIYHFECEAIFSQNQNSWRFLPVWTRGVFAVRTEIPGGIYQFGC